MNSILKKSLSFIMVFCMMFLTFAFAANVNAAEETVALASGSHNGSAIVWTAAEGNITITQAKLSSTTAVNASYISAPRVYKGHVLSFEASNGVKITNVALTYTGSYKGNSIAAGTSISGSSVAGATDITATLATANNGTHTFASVDTNGVEAMHIHNVASTNVQLRLTKIVITYVVGAASTDPELEVSATYSYALVGKTLQFTATPKNFEPTEYEWVSSNEEVATIADGVLTGLTMGTTTVKAVAGDVESEEVSINVLPDNANPITIAQALEISTFVGSNGTPVKYTAVGTVADDPSFDSSYNSVTFNLTDGTNTIKVYGMKVSAEGEIALGDKLALTGSLLQYGSTAEFNYDTTYVEYATITFMDGEEVYESYDVEVGTVITAPEAPTKTDYNFVCWLNGELEYEFGTAVTSHLTLTAKWASTALEVFDVTFDANGGTGEYEAQQVVEGDKVVAVADPVKQYATFLGWYNGGTKFDLENDVVTANMTLTAKWEEWADSVVEFVETETKASLNFSYATSGEAVATVAEEGSATLKYTAGTTSNLAADTNVAATLGLDETLFTVNAIKNTPTNNVGLGSDGTIRLYADKSGGDGCELSVSMSDEYVIYSISVTFKSASYAKDCLISAAGTDILTTTGDTTVNANINASQFSLKNVHTGDTTQVRFTTIVINYGPATPSVTYTFNNVAMRFQGVLDVATYDALVAEGAEVKFGVAAAKVSKLGGLSLVDYATANGTFFECTPELTQEGDTYLFALLLTNIPTEDFAEEVVAAAYVEVDGVKYYMTTKQFSVNSLAQYYVDNLAADEAVAPHVEALKALAKAN